MTRVPAESRDVTVPNVDAVAAVESEPGPDPRPGPGWTAVALVALLVLFGATVGTVLVTSAVAICNFGPCDDVRQAVEPYARANVAGQVLLMIGTLVARPVTRYLGAAQARYQLVLIVTALASIGLWITLSILAGDAAAGALS